MPVGITQQLLYQCLARFPGYRRTLVDQNIQLALPHLSKGDATDLASAYYRHLATLATEILRTRKMKSADFARAVTLKNPQVVRELTDNFSRSVVFVLLHQGNWEWLLHGASQQLGVTIDPLYQPPHNRRLDRYLLRQRSRFGASPINVKDIGGYVLKNRHNHKAIALLADQCPTRDEPQLNTPFLGLETPFKTGFVTIARGMNAALIFTACHRTSDGQYEVQFQSLGEPSGRPEKVSALITEYARLGENAILRQPESWLWSHRRWKHLSH